MKKLIVSAVIGVLSLGVFAGTNDFYVLHKESNRYCKMSHTNVEDRAMILVDRLGNTNKDAPTYTPDQLVSLFGRDNLDTPETLAQIDSMLKFWSVRNDGMFVLYEKKMSDIYAAWLKNRKQED
jgi:hypothetical protein